MDLPSAAGAAMSAPTRAEAAGDGAGLSGLRCVPVTELPEALPPPPPAPYPGPSQTSVVGEDVQMMEGRLTGSAQRLARNPL